MQRVLLLAFVFVTYAAQATEDPRPEEPGGKIADDPMIGREAGHERDDNALKMKLVWCAPGALTMEDMPSDPEIAVLRVQDVDPDGETADLNGKLLAIGSRRAAGKPVRVFLTKGYWLGKHEVTQSEWQRLMDSEPWKGQETTKEGAEFPATYVDWDDARAFCRKLTEQERAAGRLPETWEYALPTEAQWERACRARTETRFSFGDDESKLPEYGWFSDNTSGAGEEYPHRVGQKRPNAWGLCDMHGNVWEWCRDSYRSKLPGGRDPEVTDAGRERVMRGGGIYRDAAGCRSAYRNQHAPNWKLFDLGFRVALTRTR